MDDSKQNDELLKHISFLENKIKDLEKDLIHDSLTSLKTRAFFEEELKTYLASISNSHKSDRKEWFGFKNLSVLFLDIDHFKNVNDTYGHAIGDEVLKEVANAIKKSLREGDSVARWGGEEMVALLVGASESDAKEKAESIREKIESLVFESTLGLKVTISIGVASNLNILTLENLIENADKSLYRAKETGRNKVVAFSEL